jgi:glutathione synthase/RimK-type ligase-like ATP-grasp enzyme
MKIAIHHSKISFSDKWISYCMDNAIPYKIVNCYDSDIVFQLEDCNALMWHHYHFSEKDLLFAKQLLYSLEMAGKTVFPDFRTGWHFDDKLGQKYLLESINAPLVPSYAFYSEKTALEWVATAAFPKVFKLRRGSSSRNVMLVKSHRQAVKLIKRAFSNGFKQYDAWSGLMDRWRLYKQGDSSLKKVFDGVGRLYYPMPYSKVLGRERGYVYFQDLIPDNTHDIRINYVFNRCFGVRRAVRPGDFRASGSYIIDKNMANIPPEAIRIAFSVASKLKLQTAAFDFVMNDGEPKIVEVSYGFGFSHDQFELGYWDADLNFHTDIFNPFGWIVEGVIECSQRHYSDELLST